MSSVMTYKGYFARVEYDDDDRIFFGQLAGINDVIGFHADTVADLRAAFEEAVDDYVETCAKIGKEPERPYSGRVMFRVSPDVHRRAARAAELAGKSLNQWAEEMLDRATNAQKAARVTAVTASTFQDGIIEAREHVEEAMVGKKARVVEEIGLRQEADVRTETISDTVRETEVDRGRAHTRGSSRTTGHVAK